MIYNLNEIIVALIAFFVVGQVYVEWINERLDNHWWQQSMSHYLANADIKHHQVQDVAYLAFAAAELLLAYAKPFNKIWTIAFIVSALGVVMVIGSSLVRHSSLTPKTWMNVWHRISSGLAFGGAFIACAAYLWNTNYIWLIYGAALTVVANYVFLFFNPQEDRQVASVIQEKVFTVWIVWAMLVVTLEVYK